MTSTPAIPNAPKGRIQRKIPAPFQRPSVSIGTNAVGSKRHWAVVPVRQIAEGDIVPGIGLVHLTRETFTGHADDPAWTITLEGEGGIAMFAGYDEVWAFTTYGVSR